MLGLRSVLLLVLAFIASAQAFMLQTASQLGVSRVAATPFDRVGECPCMRCRTNLKKEKRARNRVNAFRFKKGGFQKKRFNNGPDYAADQKKADEDNKFYALMFSFTAEAEAEAQADAKKQPAQAA
eukprot:CAMPEP_0115853788 /NCGR_PEP_ID=MMETSP0287-20121206/13685_1 /TAXON_ID=412157 /ORGANISM="Chrysochromulina rotalis, Strain UIO044" /LENGTH=125 /DNA_ID=CAMNT_0003307877 /DNA_START=44 /DNA_END=421 /DNA_ORIENTATION=-